MHLMLFGKGRFHFCCYTVRFLFWGCWFDAFFFFFLALILCPQHLPVMHVTQRGAELPF